MFEAGLDLQALLGLKVQHLLEKVCGFKNKFRVVRSRLRVNKISVGSHCAFVCSLNMKKKKNGKEEWGRVEPPARRSMAPIAAHAAWQMGNWESMQQYVDVVTSHQPGGGSSEGAFLSAVLDVRRNDLASAAAATERARELLGVDMAALVGESYERAYGDMVRMQQLTELEEIIVVRAAEITTSGKNI